MGPARERRSRHVPDTDGRLIPIARCQKRGPVLGTAPYHGGAMPRQRGSPEDAPTSPRPHLLYKAVGDGVGGAPGLDPGCGGGRGRDRGPWDPFLPGQQITSLDARVPPCVSCPSVPSHRRFLVPRTGGVEPGLGARGSARLFSPAERNKSVCREASARTSSPESRPALCFQAYRSSFLFRAGPPLFCIHLGQPRDPSAMLPRLFRPKIAVP